MKRLLSVLLLVMVTVCVAQPLTTVQKADRVIVVNTNFAVSVSSAADAALTFGTISKTVAATAAPEQLSAAATQFRHAAFVGNKSARTANTGTVWIQFAAADSSAAVPLEAGTLLTVKAPPGRYYTANTFWIDVENAGDGVQVIYEP